METLADLSVMLFSGQDQWRQWLDESHAGSRGVWLKIAKKNSGVQSVTYAEALEEALCYGWIDGQKQSYDDEYFLQKFTPRRKNSGWSKINVEKVGQLMVAGKMHPAGLAAVEAAKRDGRWDRAYRSSSSMMVPPDFQAALDARPRAKEFFATLNKTNTYAFCYRVETARKPETRAARIEKFITMLERGEALY